jgi:hypothetical protein
MQDLAYVRYRDWKVCSDNWAWMQALRKGGESKSLDVECGRNMKRCMETAGFVDVRVQELRVPYGSWAAEEGPETRRIGDHSATYNWVLC